MQAAIYCRVSIEDQEREGNSLETQRDACLAKAQGVLHKVIQRKIDTEDNAVGS
jgi:DNA invertase Pin-like site-specific DNA recombinase